MIDLKKLIVSAAFLILAVLAGFVFYFSGNKKSANENPESNQNSFVESILNAPAVEGNVISSGITGKSIIGDKPFESSFEIYKMGNFKDAVTSIRTHADGTFQVPLAPGSYVLKPLNPDGPIFPSQAKYEFVVGNGQWLQVKIEYKNQ